MDSIKLMCSSSDVNNPMLYTGGLLDEASLCSALNDMLKVKQTTNSGVPNNNCKTDALAAVKQDPAVLEAQVTLSPPNIEKEGSVRTNEESMQDDDASIGEQSKPMPRFEDVVSMQEAALLSLPPKQLSDLLFYANFLRKKRCAINKFSECAFCKNNGESISWYSTHGLKDERGRVLCPVLRGYRCPRCGATGDRAHTIKYCPENFNILYH